MYKVEIYNRDKDGNRGTLLTTKWYPTIEAQKKAKAAIIWLCKNQYKFPKEWTMKIKDVVIV